jgi:hypothetical protein
MTRRGGIGVATNSSRGKAGGAEVVVGQLGRVAQRRVALLAVLLRETALSEVAGGSA